MIFYYFLPRLKPEQVREGAVLRASVLEEAGLAEVLGDVRKVPDHCSVSGVSSPVGPGEQTGTIITPVSKHRGPPELLGNDPARQKWIPAPVRKGDQVSGGKGPRYYVGHLVGDPPTPADLERWEIVPGYLVTDSKGWEWKVPTARAPGQPYGFLPQSFTFDDAGEPQPHLEPNYVWLWELVGQVRDWFVKSQGPGPDATPAERAAYEPPKHCDLVKYAARLLGVNYRVGPVELSLLHSLGRPVLTTITVQAICHAAYGWDIEDEAKKNATAGDSCPAPNSSPSTTGADTPGVVPGTGPAGAP